MPGCTAPGCTNKHFCKGLCEKHYRQRYRREQKEKITAILKNQPAAEAKKPEYTVPDDFAIGKAGPAVQEISSKKGKKTVVTYEVGIGSVYIEMMWEALSEAAGPDAVGANWLVMSEKNRERLDIAFSATGAGTTTNPWVVILAIAIFPVAVFCILNWILVVDNIKAMVKKFREKLRAYKEKRRHGRAPDPELDNAAVDGERIAGTTY